MQTSIGSGGSVRISTIKSNIQPNSEHGHTQPERLLESSSRLSKQLTIQPSKREEIAFEKPKLSKNHDEHLQKLYTAAVQQFAHNFMLQPNSVPVSSHPITASQLRMFFKLGQLPRPTRSINWWRNGLRYPYSLAVTSKIVDQQKKLEKPLNDKPFPQSPTTLQHQQRKKQQEQEQVMVAGPPGGWTVRHNSKDNYGKSGFFGRLFSGKPNEKNVDEIPDEEIGERPDRSLDIIDESPAFFFSRPVGSSKLSDFWTDGDWHPPVDEPYYRLRP